MSADAVPHRGNSFVPRQHPIPEHLTQDTYSNFSIIPREKKKSNFLGIFFRKKKSPRALFT